VYSRSTLRTVMLSRKLQAREAETAYIRQTIQPKNMCALSLSLVLIQRQPRPPPKSRPGCPPHLPSREKNQERRASLDLAPPVCVPSQTSRPRQSLERGLTSHYVRAIVGIAELLIFHPVDTIAKRLMSSKAKVSTFLLFVQMSMT